LIRRKYLFRLPNRDKNIREQDLFERYLMPYFLGGDRYLKLNEIVSIDGVDFKVIAAEPAEGLFSKPIQFSSTSMILKQIS
jgi:hypothetical protein